MAEITIEATIDSYMSANFPDSNFDADDEIFVGATYFGGDKVNRHRGIANFDCSAIAGVVVNSAKLIRYLTAVTNTPHGMVLTRCTRPADWTEAGVTWNKYDGTKAWTTGGGDWDASTPTNITWDSPLSTGNHELLGLKTFVEDAFDNRNNIVSIIIRLSDEAPGVSTQSIWRGINFGSDIWRLVIDYVSPPANRRRVVGQVI